MQGKKSIIHWIYLKVQQTCKTAVHELAITQNMLDIAVSEARAAGASQITKIRLVIGELSGVVGECVQFYFDFLKKGSIAENASIDFEVVPAKLHCRNCQSSFPLEDSSWVCPGCHSTNLEITDGQSCFIESIEVE